MAPTLPCDACSTKPCRAAFRRPWGRLPLPVVSNSLHDLPPGCPAPAFRLDRRDLEAYVHSLGCEERALALRELASGASGAVEQGVGGIEATLLRRLSDAGRPVLLPLPSGAQGRAVYDRLVREFAFISGSGGGGRKDKESGQAEVDWEKIEFERELEPVDVRAGDGEEGGVSGGGAGAGAQKQDTERTRITGIEGFCSHEAKVNSADGASQRVRRMVSAGKTLEVVPEFMKGDECSFVALGKNPGTPQWTVTLPNGSREGPKAGTEFKYTVPSVLNPASWVPTLDDFRNLLAGRFDAVEGCSPKLYTVTCRGENGERFSAGLKAYPSKTQKVRVDFRNRWEWLEYVLNEIGKNVRVFGIKTNIEIKLFKGAAWAEGGFKENPNGVDAFYNFKLAIGFSPLLGVNVKFKIPAEALLLRFEIPSRVNKYTGSLAIYGKVSGTLEANASFEREKPGKIVGSGNIAGLIGIGAVAELKILNGKILAFTAEIGSTLKAQLSPVKKIKNDTQLYVEGFIESSGLTGSVKWVLFNGVIEPGTLTRSLVSKGKWGSGPIPVMAPPRSSGGRAR